MSDEPHIGQTMKLNIKTGEHAIVPDKPSELAAPTGSDVEQPKNTPCWCGEPNPHYETLPARCGGTGAHDCMCGGDFCVCHNHGEVECWGCPDCQPEDDDEYDQN